MIQIKMKCRKCGKPIDFSIQGSDPFNITIIPDECENCIKIAASTNDDKPFEPGEVISFSDEDYVVVKNYGDSGMVKYFGDSDFDAFPFDWTFDGEKCRRVVK